MNLILKETHMRSSLKASGIVAVLVLLMGAGCTETSSEKKMSPTSDDTLPIYEDTVDPRDKDTDGSPVTDYDPDISNPAQ